MRALRVAPRRSSFTRKGRDAMQEDTENSNPEHVAESEGNKGDQKRIAK